MMNEVAMPELRTLTLLITGATGTIGRELTKKLSAQKVAVVPPVKPFSPLSSTLVRASPKAN